MTQVCAMCEGPILDVITPRSVKHYCPLCRGMVLIKELDPSLEHYFEEKPYDSASDEALLDSFAALSSNGGEKTRAYHYVKEEILSRMRR